MSRRELIALGTLVLLAGCGPDGSGLTQPNDTSSYPAAFTPPADIRIGVELTDFTTQSLAYPFVTTGKKLKDVTLSAQLLSKDFLHLKPGTYTVQQTPLPAGAALDHIECLGGDVTIDQTNRMVTIQLVAGERLQCTWIFIAA